MRTSAHGIGAFERARSMHAGEGHAEENATKICTHTPWTCVCQRAANLRPVQDRRDSPEEIDMQRARAHTYTRMRVCAMVAERSRIPVGRIEICPSVGELLGRRSRIISLNHDGVPPRELLDATSA